MNETVTSKMKYFLLMTVTFLLVMPGCDQPKEKSLTHAQGWAAVYKHDEEGNALRGSLDSLIAGIRNGYDVRVGWGWEHTIGDSLVRLEHLADPIYLSIIQEKHISAIISPHPLLESYFDVSKQSFRAGGNEWQVVFTTQGNFNAKVYDRKSGELLRDWPQKQRMTWFLEYPAVRQPNQEPLYQ